MNTKIAKNNRRKGHQWERDVIKRLRALGIRCETSRFASRKTDDAKVDVFIEDGTALNIQCKCHNAFKNVAPVLAEMPEDNNYNIVLMKVQRDNAYAILTVDDFFEILGMLKSNDIL